jgi:hypothetical protein
MDMKLEYVEDTIVEYEDGYPTGRTFSQDDGVVEKILIGYLTVAGINVTID